MSRFRLNTPAARIIIERRRDIVSRTMHCVAARPFSDHD